MSKTTQSLRTVTLTERVRRRSREAPPPSSAACMSAASQDMNAVQMRADKRIKYLTAHPLTLNLDLQWATFLPLASTDQRRLRGSHRQLRPFRQVSCRRTQMRSTAWLQRTPNRFCVAVMTRLFVKSTRPMVRLSNVGTSAMLCNAAGGAAASCRSLQTEEGA